FHHVGAPVDESDVLAHDLSNGYVAHSCFSTTSTSSSAWRMTPTASSTSICTAMPVPGLASNSPTSLTCSRIRRLKCSSTSIMSTSRGAVSDMPRKLACFLSPSPRAWLMTVQPVAPLSRAARITVSVFRSSTITTSSLKCISVLLTDDADGLAGHVSAPLNSVEQPRRLRVSEQCDCRKCACERDQPESVHERIAPRQLLGKPK